MRQLKNDIKLNEPANKVKSEKNYNFSKIVLPITQTKFEKSAEKRLFLKNDAKEKFLNNFKCESTQEATLSKLHFINLNEQKG